MKNFKVFQQAVYISWLMQSGGSMPHSQGFSNNPYPEPKQHKHVNVGTFRERGRDKDRKKEIERKNSTNYITYGTREVQCRIYKSSPIIPIPSRINPIPRMSIS